MGFLKPRKRNPNRKLKKKKNNTKKQTILFAADKSGEKKPSETEGKGF